METLRLILRKFVPDDLPDFSNLICDKMASPFSIYDDQFPTDSDSIKLFLDFFVKSNDFWAVELKSEQKLIGFISLNYVNETTRNLGYCIHGKYQRNGYAKEAVAEMIIYAKEQLKVRKLIAGTAKANPASVKLLLGNGFVIINEGIASFAKDEMGKPIEFEAYNFEKNFD